MLKPRGAICNLDCAYCFYLNKDRLYPHSSFYMSDEVLESFTRQYIQSQNTPEVTFAWQGGEPTLMGLDFYHKAIEFQHKYRQPGQKINNSLQTNATLLTDDWCGFFKQHDFLLGVSLDGPRELHDRYRRDKGGGPTFDHVMDGIRLLKDHRVAFNILACANDCTASHPLEVYRFLRDEVGAEFIQFIPIVVKSSEPGKPNEVTSVTGHAYGQFLTVVFDEWIQRDVGKVFVQVFDVALAAWAGYSPGLCVHEPACGKALAMEHNGDLYACDHFVDSKHYLGNVIERSLVELINQPRQLHFGQDKRGSLPTECQKCSVRFACHGGCLKDRLLPGPDGKVGVNVLCEGYRAFFTHIDRPMRRMAELLKSNRAPAEIMGEYQHRKINGSLNKTHRNRHRKTNIEVTHV